MVTYRQWNGWSLSPSPAQLLPPTSRSPPQEVSAAHEVHGGAHGAHPHLGGSHHREESMIGCTEQQHVRYDMLHTRKRVLPAILGAQRAWHIVEQS